jgi:hypothetical protein
MTRDSVWDKKPAELRATQSSRRPELPPYRIHSYQHEYLRIPRLRFLHQDTWWKIIMKKKKSNRPRWDVDSINEVQFFFWCNRESHLHLYQLATHLDCFTSWQPHWIDAQFIIQNPTS